MATQNRNLNLMEDQDDLLTAIWNSNALDRKYSGSLRFAKKPGAELDLSGWELVKKDVTLYAGEKGETPDGSRHYTVTVMERLAGDKPDLLYMTLADDGSAIEDEDELRNADFMHIRVASDNESTVQDTIAELVNGKIHIPKVVPENPNLVNIGFWNWNGRNACLSRRKMLATRWENVSKNYSASVGQALTDLSAVDPEHIPGKTVLLHGPPGTGKTSFLRTLALEWKSWCDLEVVIDPEVLFNNATYLTGMLEERRSSDRWTLLLLEDCDELIRKEAKQISGQALSRLLNATDGFLGYGHNLLVGITTNEPLEVLNEAVLRSGRCLAKVKVPALSREEATAWLDNPDLSQGLEGDTVLADLFALQNTTSVITERQPEEASQAAPGQYL